MAFNQIIELIKALAHLGISLAILIFILRFWREIADLLKRIKKGKILGQEFEFEKQLDKLSENIADGAKKIPELAEAPAEKKPPEKEHYDEFKKIVKRADEDPKDALNIVGNLVEVELKNLIAIRGLLQYFEKGFKFLQAVSLLQDRANITKSTASSLKQFYNLRNNIIHAQIETSKDEALRLIDLGRIILRIIRAIPRETYEVYEPNVDVFRDKECTDKYEEISGVLLKVTSPGGKIVNYRIYPTTKKDYEKGQILSWEWNSSKRWGDAWFKNPVSDKIECAWSGSLEFVGLPLQDIPIECWE